MTTWLAVLASALSASTARADAFSELKRFAGASASGPAAVRLPAPVLMEASPAAAPPIVLTTSKRWNSSFPISKEAVAAAGRAAGAKDWSKFSCEYEVGAASARCDFAYDVWPEMCWYGFDHVVTDLDVRSPERAKVVLREWRAD